MLWIQAIAQGHECLRDTSTDTTSTSFLLNAVLSLKCGVRERRHLQHHAKTADHVISVNAFICVYSTLSLSPKITMHPAYRCARLRPSDAVVKNKNFSKKNSEDLFTICINLYNIYILLKGPKFFKDYNCWFNTSPFLQFCEGEATFATTVAPQWWDSRMPGHSLGNTKNMKKNQMLRMKPRGFDDFMRKTIGINGIRRKSSKCIAYMLDWFLCAILRLLTARHLKCRA